MTRDVPEPGPSVPEIPGGQAAVAAGEKRGRGRPRKTETASTPQPSTDRPPFRAKVTAVHVHATRKIATGQFESLEIHVAADGEPDPNYKLGENLTRMATVAGQTADEVAEDIRRRIELGKGDH